MTGHFRILNISALLLLFVLSFPIQAQVSDADADKLQILALLPLTGSGADQGEWSREGLTLAEEELRQGGYGAFSLIIEDSRGDPKGAVDSFLNVSARGPVHAVISWGSGVAMALFPLMNQRQIVQLGFATATPAYGAPNDYNFRIFHSAELEGEFIAQQLLEQEPVPAAALLAVNNDYGVGIAEAFSTTFTSRGGKIVYRDTFQPQTTDFRTQLLRLRLAHPQEFVLVSYPVEGSLLLRQTRESGMSLRTIAAGAIYSGKTFLELSGGALDTLELVLPPPSQSLAAQHFREIYRKRYAGTSMVNHYSARAYDALRLLVTQNCHRPSGTCLKEALSRVKKYEGAAATYTFDENGDVSYPLTRYRFNSGEFVEVK